ncbi:MAG TPA: AMP-binding protein, partial [Gemmatimonadaceae bacterium]|nr:AMP-binding protein [Gemmatimonadaceae bacterium]
MIPRPFPYDLIDDSDPNQLSKASFAHLLRRAGDRYGDRVAISERGEQTTFEDLVARASAISRSLDRVGIRPGDVCAVLARKPRDAAAGFFAALGIGAIGINLNELYRPRQIEFVLEHSQASALVISGEILKTFHRPIETKARLVILEDIPSTNSGFAPVDRDAPSAAQITYTSGSTGQPKGVLMSHANLWAGVRVVATYLGLRSADRIAALLPFSFVYGF